MRTDRTGLMVIRVWIEEGSTMPLRAQVRATSDISVGLERTLVLADAEHVHAAVGAWLEEMLTS